MAARPVPPPSATDPAPTLGPRLGPATRLLWRSDRCVQLELGPRAVVVDGLDADDVRLLLGRRPAAPRPGAERAYAALLEDGFLWAPSAGPDDLRRSPPLPRLQAELTALSARHGEAAADLLHARRHRSVVVTGDGRGASLAAAVLAAAGVGRVSATAAGAVRPHHTVPGGAAPADEGRPLADSTAAAVTRAAPGTDTTALPLSERPDLVILAVDAPVDDEQRSALHARDCAHLLVQVGPGFGTVGPLVVPGLTACLRCTDLHRLDRDPAWRALSVQLSTARAPNRASEVALATTVAGLAAVQALAFLDGEEPATLDGSLEVRPPDWQVRRRSWPAHPVCGCLD